MCEILQDPPLPRCEWSSPEILVQIAVMEPALWASYSWHHLVTALALHSAVAGS